MKIDKIMIACAMFFVALLNCLPLNADSDFNYTSLNAYSYINYTPLNADSLNYFTLNADGLNYRPLSINSYDSINEKKTTFGLRVPIAGYSFSDADNDTFYGDNTMAFSFDLTLPGNDPNISWRIALDWVSATGDIYVNSSNNITGDLAISEWSGAVIFHNDRKEKIGVYGGLGLGFSLVTEDISGMADGHLVIDSAIGFGMGFNFFGGIKASLSDSFALGVEYFIRSLKVDMTNSDGDTYTGIDYGGQSILLTLNIGF